MVSVYKAIAKDHPHTAQRQDHRLEYWPLGGYGLSSDLQLINRRRLRPSTELPQTQRRLTAVPGDHSANNQVSLHDQRCSTGRQLGDPAHSTTHRIALEPSPTYGGSTPRLSTLLPGSGGIRCAWMRLAGIFDPAMLRQRQKVSRWQACSRPG